MRSLLACAGVVAGLGVCLPAHPISRVGNARIGDTESGFSAPIPRGFFFERETPNKGATLIAPRTVYDPRNPTAPMNSFLVLFARDFRQFFPDLARLSRDQIASYFLDSEESSWRKVASFDTCIDVYEETSETTDSLVAVWGSSKGVVFAAERGLQVRWALRDIVEGLELREGACAWP